jgi:hypothetical protein
MQGGGQSSRGAMLVITIQEHAELLTDKSTAHLLSLLATR